MQESKIEKIALLFLLSSVIMSIITCCISAQAICAVNDSCAAEPETTAEETTEAVTEPEEVTEEPTEAITEPEETTEPTESNCSDFPNAWTVHRILKENGYSEAVTAGIIGNMMAECGGQTLDLRWDAYGENGCFYGVCQWNKWTYPEVQGQDLEYQIDYLLGNIKGRFGSRYVDFLASRTPEDAALRFAVWYEGCAEWSYPVRQKYAETAFEYFTEEEK